MALPRETYRHTEDGSFYVVPRGKGIIIIKSYHDDVSDIELQKDDLLTMLALLEDKEPC